MTVALAIAGGIHLQILPNDITLLENFAWLYETSVSVLPRVVVIVEHLECDVKYLEKSSYSTLTTFKITSRKILIMHICKL